MLVTLGRLRGSGEIAVLDGATRSASVVAIEPTTGPLLTRAPCAMSWRITGSS